MEKQDAGERLYHLERKFDDFVRYLTGDKNNPADRGALANIDAIQKRLNELIDVEDHQQLEKKVKSLSDRLEKVEKFKDKIIWVIVGFSFGAGIGIGKILELFKHNI